MANRVQNNITIENAKIAFKNFSGKEGKFNPAGRRNFCVILDEEPKELVDKLIEDGWNIRWLNPKDEDDIPVPYIQVAINYDYMPPKIYMVTKKKKTLLDEEDINMLDWAELENVDLVIRPYNWEVNGKDGVKAYLKTAYFTIVEDEFADKYEDIPDSAKSAMEDND